LILAWKGEKDENIYYSVLVDKNKNEWSLDTLRHGVRTSNRPALIVIEGTIMMAWKGEDNDQGIYYGRLILSVQNSVHFVLPRQNVGRGSASSFAIQADLVLNQNGSSTFSGTFFCENSWPEPSETWAIVLGIRDGDGHIFTFKTNGGPTSGTQTWNLAANNAAITQNWPGLVINNPNPGDTNSFYWTTNDNASIDWGSVLSDIETVGEVAIEIIGTFAD
jgi:hypothetical protein